MVCSTGIASYWEAPLYYSAYPGWSRVLRGARNTRPRRTTTPTPEIRCAASLADIAGTWDIRYVPESGDTTAVTNSRIEVTADEWTLFLADRDPVEGVVTTSGDSILVVEGPYESIRRDGSTVTTNSVYRLEGDRLVGRVVAHYPTSGADSVLVLRSEGTRAP